jgi:pimeloyl-ACP methyl ester carboxylesterase
MAGPALVPAADREVRFVVDGTVTYGTVHVPAHRPGTRLASALLLPGSGPTDRDGNEPPAVTPGTLRLLAGVLGQDGVLTLRFDKYFTGRTGPGRYRDDPARIDMAAYTRQAAAGYDLLRAQPETDPHALLIVGHSEGGLQAMLLARTVWPRPAGLALLAPQDLRLLDMIDYQLAGQLDQAVAAGRLTAGQGAANKAGVSRAIADFRAGRPVRTDGLVPELGTVLRSLFGPVNARFVRSDDAIYPPEVARGIDRGTSTLVTCGTADPNVPCRTTAPLLAALRQARTTGPGLVVLRDVDHFLHPAGTGLNEQTLAPAAVAALHAFVRPWRRPAGSS